MGLQVPLEIDDSKRKAECSVWDWTGEAIDEGSIASEYLSDFMGHRGKPSQHPPFIVHF